MNRFSSRRYVYFFRIKCLIACMKSTPAFMEVLLLSTISNVFSVNLACAVWCADPKGGCILAMCHNCRHA